MSRQKNSSNIIINTLSLLVLTTLSIHYFPLYLVCVFLIPAIISKMICNHGLSKSLLAGISIIIFVIVYVLTGVTAIKYTAVLQAVLIILPGYILGISFSKSLKFSETLTSSIAIDFIISALFIAYYKYILNINLAEEMRNNMSDVFFNQIDLISALYPEAASQLSDAKGQVFRIMYVVTPGIVPFFIFLSSILLFLPKYMLSKAFCKKYLIENCKFQGGFDTFSVGIITFIAFLICIAGMTLSTSNLGFMVFLCAFLCISFIYMLVALSIIDFKLKTKTRSTQKRYLMLLLIIILLVILCAVMPVINPIYIFLLIGITDTFFDIRKLKPKKGEFYEKK